LTSSVTYIGLEKMSNREKKIKLANSLDELFGGSSEELRALERELNRKKKELPNQDALFETKRQTVQSILLTGDLSEILRLMLNQQPSLADISAELNIALSVLNYVKEKLVESSEEFFEFFEFFLQYFSKIVNHYEAEFEKSRFYNIFLDYLVEIFKELTQSNLFSLDDLSNYLDFVRQIPNDILPLKYRMEFYGFLVKSITVLVLTELTIEPLEITLDYFFREHRERYGLNIINSLIDSIESTYMEYIIDEDKMEFFDDFLEVVTNKLREFPIKEEFTIPFRYKVHEVLKTWILNKNKIKITQDILLETLEIAKQIIGEDKANKLIEEFNIFTKKQIKFIR